MKALMHQMMSKTMLMTVDGHQAALATLDRFYQNPKLFLNSSENNRDGTICHMSVLTPTSHRFDGLDDNCEEVTSYRRIRAEITELVRNPNIEEVYVEFDGPGGEASGCFDCADYIAELTKEKPIIAFINGGSFSANYALASACTKIYATSGSLAGSIGAIRGRVELSSDSHKVHYFTSGEAKADGALHKVLDDGEAERYQNMVNQMGWEFCELVARNRGITSEAVHALQANVFNANDLLAHKLIDGIKTEEEITMMMTTATHKNVVNGLKTQHSIEMAAAEESNRLLQEENQTLEAQLQALVKQGSENSQHIALMIKQMDQLTRSAGVAELSGNLATQIADGDLDIEGVKKVIKTEAAKKDEEISLIGGFKSDESDYDMQQLIAEA